MTITTEILIFDAGKVFGLSTGRYSDYVFNCLFVAIKEVDLKSLWSLCKLEYYKINPQENSWDDPFDQMLITKATLRIFATYLIKNELAIPIDYTEVHTDDFDD